MEILVQKRILCYFTTKCILGQFTIKNIVGNNTTKMYCSFFNKKCIAWYLYYKYLIKKNNIFLVFCLFLKGVHYLLIADTLTCATNGQDEAGNDVN